MSGSASFQIVGKTIFDYFLSADNPPRIVSSGVQRAAQAIITPTDGSDLRHQTWPL